MPIRVATLNIWSLPGPLARHKPERMSAIGAALQGLDLDVMAFQEVWTEPSREALIAAVKRAGLTHVWHNPALSGGSGLLVASQLPIREVHFEAFAAQGFAERIQHMDFYSGKGFTRIGVETPDGPLVLVDTHLHANYSHHGEPDEYVGVRAAQFIQIATGLSSVTDPVIALGDFNLRDDEDAYAMLRGLSGLRDLAAELDHRQATSLKQNPYHPPDYIDERIDYVFCRDGASVGLQPKSIKRCFDEILDFGGEAGTYSDHAGLVAELSLGPAAPPQALNPLRASAFEIGARLLGEGRDISIRRRQRQRGTAAGAFATGLAGVAGARAAGRSRRRFLRNGLGFAAGMGFAVFAEQIGLSYWAHRGEMAGYNFAERQLTELRRNG
jgi:endonuclease/exonuclease/phosphatase family metal-dependent hydrolase